jgi:dTDP-4-dehydrorhamnose reductase
MILVTGLSGMVGKYAHTYLNENQLEHQSLNRKNFDLSNLHSIDSTLKNKKFTHFIHLAAETNVDFCETNPQHAYVCNFLATKKIAQYCAEVGARLIFISTSGVFGAQGKTQYCELDLPSPSNLYGLSKLHAEQAVTSICKNSLIIRAGWMIGGGEERDSKFVGKIMQQLRENKKEISAVSDKFGAITHAKHLAKLIIESLNENYIGVKHFSSYDICSRYDIAKAIKQKLNAACKIIPVNSSIFPTPAQRGTSEAIYSVIPQELINAPNYSWSELLNIYLEEEFHV